MRLTSQLLITSDIDVALEKLEDIKTDEQFIKIISYDNFLVDDAKLAIEKAYITSDNRAIIILASNNFSDIVQNRLLKIIEEPPPNKEFIIITTSKSSILPTIKSRLPIYTIKNRLEPEDLGLDLKNLNLEVVYNFLQENKRINSINAKDKIQKIIKEAIFSKSYNLDRTTLDLFDNSYKALDKGSPPPFILSALMLKLLAKKKR